MSTKITFLPEYIVFYKDLLLIIVVNTGQSREFQEGMLILRQCLW